GAVLHRRLVGLDLGEQVVDRDGVADLLVPHTDLTLLHGGGELRHLQDLGHLARLYPWYVTARTFSTMRSTPGITCCSSFALYGMGKSRVVGRRMGASRSSNASRWMRSATSAPTPP